MKFRSTVFILVVCICTLSFMACPLSFSSSYGYGDTINKVDYFDVELVSVAKTGTTPSELTKPDTIPLLPEEKWMRITLKITNKTAEQKRFSLSLDSYGCYVKLDQFLYRDLRVIEKDLNLAKTPRKYVLYLRYEETESFVGTELYLKISGSDLDNTGFGYQEVTFTM